MNKKALTGADIRTKFITPAIVEAITRGENRILLLCDSALKPHSPRSAGHTPPLP